MKRKTTKILALFCLSLAMSCGESEENVRPLQDMELIPVQVAINGDKYKTVETYVTLDGTVAFDKKFSRADFFSDGLAKVTQIGSVGNWKYSFINTKGEEVFDAPYENVTGFWNGMAWAKIKDDKAVALNTKGEEVFVLEGTPKSMFNADGKALIEDNHGKRGIVNRKGKIQMLPDSFRYSTPIVIYADRLVAARQVGKYRYEHAIVDLKGKIVVNFGVYEKFGFNFDINGCISADTPEGTILIDKNGKKLSEGEFTLSNKYKFYGTCDGDLYVFRYNASQIYSWWDKHGKEVGRLLEPTQVYKTVRPAQFQGFNGGEYAFWGNLCIDRKGNIMEMPFYRALSPLLGGKAVFARIDESESNIGLFNIEGHLLTNDFYDLPYCVKDLPYRCARGDLPYIDTKWVTGRGHWSY